MMDSRTQDTNGFGETKFRLCVQIMSFDEHTAEPYRADLLHVNMFRPGG